MKIKYKPKGVCSRLMEVETEDNKITKVEVTGGCSGNLQGISRLVVGMDVQEAIDRLALLAEYGDLAARTEIVKSYTSSKALKQKVVMGLVFLYGLDVLASAPEGQKDNTMDFIFTATDIAAYGASNVEADVLLITLRDDPRLRDAPVFNRIADQFIFIGGFCDALAERAKANNVPGMEADACSAASRRALMAWAETRGPDGSEAQVRRQAAEALNKLSP